MLMEILNLVQLVFLSVALPFSVIAARGYSDAPFGKVLRPLPAVAGIYLVSTGLVLLPFPWTDATVVFAVLWTGAVVAIALSAYRLIELLTGRRLI